MMRSAWAVVGVAVLAVAIGCTTRARRPDGPFREAEEFVDNLSDEAVSCTRRHAPQGQGRIVVAADLSEPRDASGVHRRPVIRDAGSMAGSEAVIACIQDRVAQKLRLPASAPARFARVYVPVPLRTEGVTYNFTNDQPTAGAK